VFPHADADRFAVLIDQKGFRQALVLKGQQEIKTSLAEHGAVTPQNSPSAMLSVRAGALARTGRCIVMAEEGWTEDGVYLVDGHTVPKGGHATLGDTNASL
jgi:hypothetical protein